MILPEKILRWIKYNKIRAILVSIMPIITLILITDMVRGDEEEAIVISLILTPIILLPEVKRAGSQFINYYKKL